MGRRQDTQPTASGYGQPSRRGLSVGAIQAASPLGFWWLDPATFTILKYRFSSRRRRSSCSCGPSSASVISPDLEHGERLILVLVQEAIDRTSLQRCASRWTA